MVNLSPETVFLVYNCYYMPNICANAKHFSNVVKIYYVHGDDDGLDLLDIDDKGPTFGYDLNTGKKSTSRAEARYERMSFQPKEYTHLPGARPKTLSGALTTNGGLPRGSRRVLWYLNTYAPRVSSSHCPTSITPVTSDRQNMGRRQRWPQSGQSSLDPLSRPWVLTPEE